MKRIEGTGIKPDSGGWQRCRPPFRMSASGVPVPAGCGPSCRDRILQPSRLYRERGNPATAPRILFFLCAFVSLCEFPVGACRHEGRSEEHTSELQSLMRTSYAVFCL